MCGIYGCITAKQLTDKQYKIRNRILDSLAIINEERGDESTGIATITGNKFSILKKTVASSNFVFFEDYISEMNKNSDIVLGHTRLATTGKISEENAHPFNKGSIIGAHNGIITNHYDLDRNVSVDSEAIFSLLNEHKNDYLKALPKVQGSFALEWYDLENPDKIHLALHNNPISIAVVEELKTIFWSSEYLDLLSVINSAIGIGDNLVLELSDDMIYTIDKKLEYTEEALKMPNNTYKWKRVENEREDSLDNYDNIRAECSICGFEFMFDSVVYHDYKTGQVYCNICEKFEKSKTIDKMSLNEYKAMAYYDD